MDILILIYKIPFNLNKYSLLRKSVHKGNKICIIEFNRWKNIINGKSPLFQMFLNNMDS